VTYPSAVLLTSRVALAGAALLLSACRHSQSSSTAPSGAASERVQILALDSGVTATIVAPEHLDPRQRVELILYALPNGNTTAQTMGRALTAGMDWHYDIQHIGAQTRALRARGMSNAIVAYLEADTKSWPEWRRVRGYENANARIVAMVDRVRAALGNPSGMMVTLSGHSGGGSFFWGFIEGQPSLPDWLERIAFLDANYSFEPRHGEKIAAWLRRSERNALVVLAYDDRNIMLDGKRVITDSTGGTWRASQRMMDFFRPMFALTPGTLGEFVRYRGPQIEFLLHPNPANRILHTEMIGEMNGYMHAMLARRPDYESGESVLRPVRAYARWIEP